MTAAHVEEARRLLRIARADLDACMALLNAPGIRFANAAFHAQQATEKSLRGQSARQWKPAGVPDHLVICITNETRIIKMNE